MHKVERRMVKTNAMNTQGDNRVIHLKHGQIVILQIVARLALDMNTREPASPTRLEPESRFTDT